jgi:hypothetical protein
MQITRLENGNVHLQLYKRVLGRWEKVFDFEVASDEWIELKEHILKTIGEFEKPLYNGV